jgi:hypothetical protein
LFSTVIKHNPYFVLLSHVPDPLSLIFLCSGFAEKMDPLMYTLPLQNLFEIETVEPNLLQTDETYLLSEARTSSSPPHSSMKVNTLSLQENIPIKKEPSLLLINEIHPHTANDSQP